MGRSLSAEGTSSLAGQLARLYSVTQSMQEKLNRIVMSEEDLTCLLISTYKMVRNSYSSHLPNDFLITHCLSTSLKGKFWQKHE